VAAGDRGKGHGYTKQTGEDKKNSNKWSIMGFGEEITQEM